MSNSLSATKKRINSINTTKKITNAMKLVATAKLKTAKNKLGDNRRYVEELQALLGDAMKSLESGSELDLNKFAKGDKTLFLVITSSMGLCGGYNLSIYKKFIPLYQNGDEIEIIGDKGYSYLTFNGYKVNDSYINALTGFDYAVARKIGKDLLSRFKTGKYKKIVLVGTMFINQLVFEPTVLTLFPFEATPGKGNTSNVEIEPSPEKIISTLIPQYINSVVYSLMLNSYVSEQASRRNAMENATDNADELVEDLKLEYNKARQTSITQEITEVVSGANAVK